MKLLARAIDYKFDGRLMYHTDEYSFEYIYSQKLINDMSSSLGRTSLLIGTLQLEVDIQTERLLFVWGFLPYHSWRKSYIAPGKYVTGDVKIISNDVLEPGVSISLVPINEWKIQYDERSGWVCIGNHLPSRTADLIEFAQSTVADIDQGSLRAIWLHPDFEGPMR